MKYDVLKTASLLYVEDEEDIREQMSHFLKKRVGRLYTASNGREGLNVFERSRPDVVLTDIKMPVMNGLEMTEAIRDIDPDVPVIVTTAFNEQDYFMKAIETGIDKYVLKPVKPDELMETLEKTASVLVQRREIAAYNRFVRLVLDSSPCFMMTTRNEEIEYVNKSFLDYLGYRSLDELKHSHRRIKSFFGAHLKPPYRVAECSSPFSRIVGNPDAHDIVYLETDRVPQESPKACIVTCRISKEMN